MSKSRKFIIVISLLTSIGLAIFSYLFPNNPNLTQALIISIVGINLGLLIDNKLAIFDIESKANISPSNKELLDHILLVTERINIKNEQNQIERRITELSALDPYFAAKHKELENELVLLTQGEYRINSSHNVYEDDIRSMRLLGEGDNLRSMCFMDDGSEQSEHNKLNNSHYQSTVREHIETAKRGVRVTRIYLFKNKENAYISDIQQHLLELKKEIDVKVIFLEEIEFDFELDFLIFNKVKVSRGIFNKKHELIGASVHTQTAHINESINHYDSYLNVAKELKDIYKQDS